MKKSTSVLWYLLPLLIAGLLALLLWQKNTMPEEQQLPSRRYIAIVKQDTLQQSQVLKQGIEMAAEHCGVYVQVTAVSDFEEQRYEVQRALYSGFDGMLLTPIENGRESADMMAEINASIPCLELLDDQDPNNLPITFSSNAAMGQIAAQQLMDSGFTEDKNLHIFIGNSEDSFARSRAEAFEEALAQHGCTVDGTLTIGVNIISSDERIKEYIRDNQVDYIFCADDLSTIAAAKCAYSVMYPRPFIIGCGTEQDHMEYFTTKTIQVLLSIDYEKMGRLALEYLDRYCMDAYLPEDYDLCLTVYRASCTEGIPFRWSDVNHDQTP